MNCILDTSTLIWVLTLPDKISKDAHNAIFDPEKVIHVSTVSFIEMAIKINLGKLDLKGIDLDDLLEILYENGIDIIDINPFEAIALRKLPLKENHKDLFGRMIITQAIHRNLALISGDKMMKQYCTDGLALIW
jgi:PIN domain nuclease of toxin-antitoxin system